MTTSKPVATAAWLRQEDDVVHIVGNTGFGPGVQGALEVQWPAVAGAFRRHVLLLGRPEDRGFVISDLIETYRSAVPSIEVTTTVDGVGLLDEFSLALDDLRASGGRLFDERARPRRLVVIEVDDAYRSRLEQVVTTLATRGRIAGWSLLLATDTLTGFESEEAIRGNTEIVFALEPIEPSPAVGAGIAAALRGGVRTLSGITEVARGVPVEWVLAFEHGEQI